MITLSVSEIEKREFPIKCKAKGNFELDHSMREITIRFVSSSGYAETYDIDGYSTILHSYYFSQYEIIEDKMKLKHGDKIEIDNEWDIGDLIGFKIDNEMVYDVIRNVSINIIADTAIIEYSTGNYYIKEGDILESFDRSEYKKER